jgi:protein SCO1/2
MLCLTIITATLLLPLATMIGPGRRWRALTPAFVIAVLAAGSLPAIAAGSAAPDQAAAAVGGPFTLVDQDGREVTDETYRGKWLLVYFGYTHCPDACPTALSNMAAALDLLDAGTRARLQPIFVTVDPERDTPAVMRDYVGAFEGAGIVGLSGTQDQVAAIETSYRILARRHDEGNGDYSIDHTSVIHIIDPAGHFVGLVSDLMQPERLAGRLAQMVN